MVGRDGFDHRVDNLKSEKHKVGRLQSLGEKIENIKPVFSILKYLSHSGVRENFRLFL